MIPMSKGSKPAIIPGKSRSHQSSPLLFLSPGGPVIFFGGELEAAGTGTTVVNDGGAVKVTEATEVGGMIFGSKIPGVNSRIRKEREDDHSR
jgi:hypothetical protein